MQPYPGLETMTSSKNKTRQQKFILPLRLSPAVGLQFDLMPGFSFGIYSLTFH